MLVSFETRHLGTTGVLPSPSRRAPSFSTYYGPARLIVSYDGACHRLYIMAWRVTHELNACQIIRVSHSYVDYPRILPGRNVSSLR